MDDPALAAADSQERLRALNALIQSGDDLKPWTLDLVRLSDDPDGEVAHTACDGLEMLGPPRIGDLPALIAVLQSQPHSEQSYWAATLIGRLGPAGKTAVSALMGAVGHSRNLMVRERSAWALGQIGPAAAPARDVLEAAVSGVPQQPRLKRLIMQALESIRGFAA
jgi:HEAT repeat protein